MRVHIVEVRFTRRYQSEYAYTSKVYTYRYDGSDTIVPGNMVCVPVHDMSIENYAIAKVEKVYEATGCHTHTIDGDELKFIIGRVPVEEYKERVVKRVMRNSIEKELDARVQSIVIASNRETIALIDPKVRALLDALKIYE